MSRFKNVKIFLVGAGGIGCEVLKNLVMCNFPYIEVVDLDTIELSNLNRQFLFHKENIGQPKAIVARETALGFNPNTEIISHYDNIMNTKYGVGFFKRFSIVINALDNRAARSHVNRMCLAADVPLIETGTAGYFGQVEMIKKGLTQCYDCEPKAPPVTYPGCTIRNTPSETIHCVVWAKFLFNQLFGEEDADNEVSPDSSDPEALGENDSEKNSNNKNLRTDTVAGNIARVSTRAWALEIEHDPEKLFKKFFVDDINYLLKMENLWKERRPPVPCSLEWKSIEEYDPKSEGFVDVDRTMKVWTLKMCVKVFSESCRALRNEFLTKPEGEFLTWDKDDKIALDFVTACAGIRCFVFNIAVKSRFDVKGMAGRIIPAIPTANSIIAGIATLYAMNVLDGNIEKNTTVYLRRNINHCGQLFVPEKRMIPPNPKCYVCSPKNEVVLVADVNQMTIRTFVEKVLKSSLHIVAPDAYVPATGNIVISSEEDEIEENFDKHLADMQIIDGSIVKVDDFFQEYELTIIIKHQEYVKDKPEFEIIGDIESFIPGEVKMSVDTSEPGSSAEKHDSSDDCSIVGETTNHKDDDSDVEIVEENNEISNVDDQPPPIKIRRKSKDIAINTDVSSKITANECTIQ